MSKNQKGPRTYQALVTPALAQEWLAKNTPTNRNVSMHTVQAYADEMKAGRWVLTHQGVAFNAFGELIDGQHRLKAVVMSGASVEMMVTTDLELEYNSPLDQGYNRSFAHILGKNSRWVSVVRGLIVLELGLPAGGFKATSGKLQDCALRHEEGLTTLLGILKAGHGSPSGLVALLAYLHPVDRAGTEAFAKQMDTGEGLIDGDPALALRRWVSKGRHTPLETILASAGAARYALQKKPLMKITAGVTGEEKNGHSHYVWIVQRRRGKNIWAGTPSMALVGEYRRDDEEA
jgi:hypothetical protein